MSILDKIPFIGKKNTSGETPHKLEDRTKRALYERARELDIAGRSKMSKEQLIHAIRERE